jgi:hypothetical protein
MSHLPKLSSSELSHLQPETILLSKESFNKNFQADERIQPTADLEAKNGFSQHLLVFFVIGIPNLMQQFAEELLPCFRSDAIGLRHIAKALHSELHSGLWGELHVEALVNRLVELILLYHSNLEADSVEDAKAKLATIPFAKIGVTAFDTVIAIEPFTGFSALFEKN